MFSNGEVGSIGVVKARGEWLKLRRLYNEECRRRKDADKMSPDVSFRSHNETMDTKDVGLISAKLFSSLNFNTTQRSDSLVEGSNDEAKAAVGHVWTPFDGVYIRKPLPLSSATLSTTSSSTPTITPTERGKYGIRLTSPVKHHKPQIDKQEGDDTPIDWCVWELMVCGNPRQCHDSPSPVSTTTTIKSTDNSILLDYSSATFLLRLYFDRKDDTVPPRVVFTTIPFHPNVCPTTGVFSPKLVELAWNPPNSQLRASTSAYCPSLALIKLIQYSLSCPILSLHDAHLATLSDTLQQSTNLPDQYEHFLLNPKALQYFRSDLERYKSIAHKCALASLRVTSGHTPYEGIDPNPTPYDLAARTVSRPNVTVDHLAMQKYKQSEEALEKRKKWEKMVDYGSYHTNWKSVATSSFPPMESEVASEQQDEVIPVIFQGVQQENKEKMIKKYALDTNTNTEEDEAPPKTHAVPSLSAPFLPSKSIASQHGFDLRPETAQTDASDLIEWSQVSRSLSSPLLDEDDLLKQKLLV